MSRKQARPHYREALRAYQNTIRDGNATKEELDFKSGEIIEVQDGLYYRVMHFPWDVKMLIEQTDENPGVTEPGEWFFPAGETKKVAILPGVEFVTKDSKVGYRIYVKNYEELTQKISRCIRWVKSAGVIA